MRRSVLLIAIVVAAAGITAVWAVAAQQASGPATITGCLKQSGALVRFAVGAAPLQTCNKNDKQVVLSGGDITSIASPSTAGSRAAPTAATQLLASSSGSSCRRRAQPAT